jgi:hypothetical protein
MNLINRMITSQIQRTQDALVGPHDPSNRTDEAKAWHRGPNILS